VDLGLTDRVYVVSDAGAGLGRACAEQLAAEGARLVLAGPDDEALAKVAAELGGAERAIGVSGDLSDPGIETCLVAAAVARYGRLDGALVVPGAPPAGGVVDTSDGDWRLGLEEYVLGPLRLCRAVVKNVTQEGGSLVLVLSTAVRESAAGHALAAGLQPALAMSAKALADEQGPRAVRVNTLLAGPVDAGRAARRGRGVRRRPAGCPVSRRRPARVRPAGRVPALTGRELCDGHGSRCRRRFGPHALNSRRLPAGVRR
jgi:3-oxoacyl-[acyl-carrier protein] reductase